MLAGWMRRGRRRETAAVPGGGQLLPLFGRAWRVGKRTRQDREELERYARENCPRPIHQLRDRLAEAAPEGAPLATELTVKLFGDAFEADRRWPPAFGSAEFQAFYGQPEHAPYLFWVALRRHQPETTLDDVRALFDRAEDDQVDDAERRERHELDVLNVTRRFLLGAERPLSAEDLRRRREEREAAEERLLVRTLGAAILAAAELAERTGRPAALAEQLRSVVGRGPGA